MREALDKIPVSVLTGAAAAFVSILAAAQSEPSEAGASSERDMAEVVVSAESGDGLSLDGRPRTGSSLGLTARETPATIDVLTQRQMQELGARTTEEALNRAPGVSSTSNATSPGSIALRGFTGAGRAVLLLYDGVRPAEEAFFTRVIDSWLFERLEVLKGPAAVDYGEGALAGVINLVPKRARLDGATFAGQAGYGSFGSFRAAVDANVVLVDELALRPVLAYQRSSGYVDDAPSQLLAGTLGVTWAPSNELVVELALDYLRDDYDSAYFGTPLIPAAAALDASDRVRSADGRVLDESLRDINYNVEDGISDSTTGWLRSAVRWQLGRGWVLSNDLHLYTSDRRFQNAEYFGYDAASGLVGRSTGLVTHDFEYALERATLRGEFSLGGLKNRAVVGGSYGAVDFFTERRFGSTSSVDLRDPARGLFPAGDDPTTFPRREDRQNAAQTASIFAEDALELTPSWLLLGGVRYEHIDIERSTLELNSEPPTLTPIGRDFDELTWRIGSVYDLSPSLQVFGQYSTAAAPPSSLLALSAENAAFDMTRGWAAEVGLKGSLFDERLELTASAFYIAQDDIVSRSPADPAVSVQGGRQSSRGAELSLSARPLEPLRLLINYSFFDARFDELVDAAGDDLAGNTPERVPERVLNAFVFFEAPGLPLSASVGVHSAGRYFTDNANTIEVGGYATLEAALGCRLALAGSTADVTLRGRNLTNSLYAGYTDISPDQLSLAPPRSVDLLVTARY